MIVISDTSPISNPRFHPVSHRSLLLSLRIEKREPIIPVDGLKGRIWIDFTP